MKDSRIGFCTVIVVLLVIIGVALAMQYDNNEETSSQDQIAMSYINHTYLFQGIEAIEI